MKCRHAVSPVGFNDLYCRMSYLYPIIQAWLFIPPGMASVVCISDVSVEWNFLFPLCVADSLSLDNKKGIN